ncbi:uncharacterized protein Z518_06178 [Rhinocladiella mackenziei CBS 650.93]|uniref:Small-subunit processome Utp12 domain-containing protein n=1 Tax=Rhinocladiella mackenziei CBS 650.93 TaxID=1442369 RepID=A0A0D2IQ39_9EURO|nr:uncharacterized protein Z518_06178 [Rhinocladiella mackenziei CBS 650.93]KIX05306.1 hypothetical protein Z518_06178 [Rhinocladiella mackenziei CBS 650.93]
MGRKSSSTAVSKVSSTSTPAVSASSTTVSAPKSALLKCAFAPSQFQLHLFALVIQSFDTQQLRIHDTNTGRLRCQHSAAPGSKITCLDWGFYGSAYREQQQESSKKKRKRDQSNNEGVVIAYGTSTSEVRIFSPTEGKLLATLSGAHERSVKDFKFDSSDYKQGWSIGEDARLVQWDLVQNRHTRTISLPDPAINILATPSRNPPQILCASSTPFAIDVQSSDDFRIARYDSFKNPVHQLFRSNFSDSTNPEYFLAADTDRYLNVYDIPKQKLVRTLVAGAGITSADLSSPPKDTSEVLRQQVLCAVTKVGTVELFSQPLAQSKQLNGDLKSSRKTLTKKPSASVRLISSDNKGKLVPIISASLQGPDLVVVSADGGIDFSFQKIRWQDEGNGELLFEGTKEVVKVTSASTLNTVTLTGAKDTSKAHVDESRTVVVNGGAGARPQSDAIEISSSESDGEDEEDEDSADEMKTNDAQDVDDERAASVDADEVMADTVDQVANEPEDEEFVQTEQTFGERLASQHPHEISAVPTEQPDNFPISIPFIHNKPLLPSGMSLGAVLTQSLRTNDRTLLEACLHTLDTNIVKNTIQRLDSSLAGLLLSKLAERLASRPGRYGHLITWVQWTCIAHGGAIAAQPDVTAKVRTLYQVLTQRSKTLDSLLLLKGKLDMLDAQLEYRKQLAAQRPARREQDEPGMIYIEGTDNWDSEDEDLDEDASRPTKRIKGKGKGKARRMALEDLIADDDENEIMPLANGDLDSDKEEDEDEEDERNGLLLDDEAEVTDNEDSDPDGSASDAAGSSEDEDSADESESGSEEGDDDEDSEMNSFINDGSISVAEDEDDVHIPGDSSQAEDEGEDEEQEPELKTKVKPRIPAPGSNSKTASAVTNESNLIRPGNSFFVEDPPDKLETPLEIRSPEMIFDNHISMTQGSWVFGCFAYNVLTNSCLFDLAFIYNKDSRDDAHLIQLFSLLGPLPARLKHSWPRYGVYFDDEAQLKKFVTAQRTPQEYFDHELHPSIVKVCERKIRKDQDLPESVAEYTALNPPLRERWLDEKHPDVQLEDPTGVFRPKDYYSMLGFEILVLQTVDLANFLKSSNSTKDQDEEVDYG